MSAQQEAMHIPEGDPLDIRMRIHADKAGIRRHPRYRDTVEILSDAVFGSCNSLKRLSFGKSLRRLRVSMHR